MNNIKIDSKINDILYDILDYKIYVITTLYKHGLGKRISNRINYKLFGQLVHTQNKEQPWRLPPFINDIYDDEIHLLNNNQYIQYNFIVYDNKYVIGRINARNNIVIFNNKFKIRGNNINLNKNKEKLLYKNIRGVTRIKTLHNFIYKLKKLNIEVPEYIISKAIINNI